MVKDKLQLYDGIISAGEFPEIEDFSQLNITVLKDKLYIDIKDTVEECIEAEEEEMKITRQSIKTIIKRRVIEIPDSIDVKTLGFVLDQGELLINFNLKK